MHRIWLPRDLIERCRATAIEREKIKDPKTDRRMVKNRKGEDLHFMALTTECAVAKYLGQPELVSFSVEKSGDNGIDFVMPKDNKKVQVKASSYSGDPWIRFDPDGSQRLKADLVVLTTPLLDACVDLIGWITREEFFRDAKLIDMGFGDKLVFKPSEHPLRKPFELWVRYFKWW